MTISTKLIALAIAGATTVSFAGTAMAKDRQSGEEKLAEMLEGRVAGEPQRCINTFRSGDLKVIDGTALVYERGKTIWVNVPQYPDALDDSDVLVTYPSLSSQLCRLDRVETRDRLGLFFSGVIFLNDFVPYTKAEG